jgi:hypothetical protein
MGTVAWRLMCFQKNGEKLIKIVDVGMCQIDLIADIVSPNDQQEMCGSYRIEHGMLAQLVKLLQVPNDILYNYDVFIERDS